MNDSPPNLPDSGERKGVHYSLKRREFVMVDQELLDILACPKCKGDLEYDEKVQTLTCRACKLRYRIEDDIPIMLIDEAEKIA